jgi:hypothetical protein
VVWTVEELLVENLFRDALTKVKFKLKARARTDTIAQ